MSEYLFEQFNLARQSLLGEIDKLDSNVVDVQPEGFNNTVHWHIGHILTVTEQFLFSFPDKTDYLPENYKNLFGPRTKPADWSGDVPTVDVLAGQLNSQLERINKIPAEQLDIKLDESILGKETFGGLASMSVFHETFHTGQIHAMQLAAKASKN